MYGLGEKVVHLHCDNCSGQNKNRYVLFYLLWRVMKGLHTEITINFMPPGHTKSAPDWCFGLLKRCFRRAEVSCLNDLCDVVRESTPVARVNIPQLVAREDGTVIVPTYDWQAYFSPVFKPLPGIKKFSLQILSRKSWRGLLQDKSGRGRKQSESLQGQNCLCKSPCHARDHSCPWTAP